jgi:hypothetical protein
MQNVFALTLLVTLLASAATVCTAAGPGTVRCKIGGKDLAFAGVVADHNYSASGVKGATGQVSRFRLIGFDDPADDGSGIELKTVDVTVAGDYALSTESLWRSTFRAQGKEQRVSSGRFRFTRFEMKESRGRAQGTVEFSAGASGGSCSFDVEVKGVNRDRL